MRQTTTSPEPAGTQAACRWCGKTGPTLRRPVEQLRPLLEGGGRPVHGCGTCLTIVESNLTTRGLQLLVTTTCRPWCIDHKHDRDGDTCLAPAEPGPGEPGRWPGEVTMVYDTVGGYVINLECQTEVLGLEAAELLARSILAQIGRAGLAVPSPGRERAVGGAEPGGRDRPTIALLYDLVAVLERHGHQMPADETARGPALGAAMAAVYELVHAFEGKGAGL